MHLSARSGLRFLGGFCLLLGLTLAAPSARADDAADGRLVALEREEIASLPGVAQTIDLTAPAQDLWVRIRNGFAMPNLNDELVLRHQQYYQSHPEYLRRMVERSSRYLHHIVEELEKRGMPTELALLPMVESAYNPMAYSPARASGLWQFIPSTGKNFNLEQDWWHDERRDIVASTSAALDYLQYIYELHGDWHLALAAYNWGEGAVGRAVARNEARGLPTDYLSLNLPSETRHYVPKLQALKNIFANPRLMAELRIPSIPNKPYFRTVTTALPIDLSLAARFAGMSTEEFVALNPAHNRPVIQADSTLVIPADRVESFKLGMSNHDAPLCNWQTYALRPGEKLEQVAPRFGISLDDLKRVNGLSGRIKVNPGQSILVPAQGEAVVDAERFAAAEPPAAVEAPTSRRATPARFYVVQKGDTLKSIARKHAIELTELRRMNPGSKGSLKPGSRIVLTAAGQAESTASGRARQASTTSQPVERRVDKDGKRAVKLASAGKSEARNKAPRILHYTVRKGDTLFSIAKRYKVEQDDLRRWNKLGSSGLKVGATLTIQGDG